VVPGAHSTKGDAEATPLSAANRARVIIDLPANAKLYVDDRLSRSTEEQRHFETPELTPGKAYQYDLRVEWTQDGKPVTETKKIVVRAGQITRASFKDVESSVTAANQK
jgi:uncharacterized protein (TIGR03000 family)